MGGDLFNIITSIMFIGILIYLMAEGANLWMGCLGSFGIMMVILFIFTMALALIKGIIPCLGKVFIIGLVIGLIIAAITWIGTAKKKKMTDEKKEVAEQKEQADLKKEEELLKFQKIRKAKKKKKLRDENKLVKQNALDKKNKLLQELEYAENTLFSGEALPYMEKFINTATQKFDGKIISVEEYINKLNDFSKILKHKKIIKPADHIDMMCLNFVIEKKA